MYSEPTQTWNVSVLLRISECKHSCILHFHLHPGIAAQNQLLSGFALTAWCPLPPAAVWSSFSWAQCCQTLWSWLYYQMSPEWNGLFYHLTQWQLSPRHPDTCKGRYMTLLMPHHEAECISDWDGQQSNPSQDRRLAPLAEPLERKPEVSSQVPWVQGVMEICQECTLFTLIDKQSGKESYNLHSLLSWREGEQRTAESVEKQAGLFI